MCYTLPEWVFSVSYTHLDVYKRQVPDYALEKILKHYEGNKEVGGRIYTESEGLTSISYGEIGDKARCV